MSRILGKLIPVQKLKEQNLNAETVYILSDSKSIVYKRRIKVFFNFWVSNS